jgi:hypothetical protein
MKPISDTCCICKKKIDPDGNWADVGPKEKANATAHLECLGLGPMLDKFQDSLNRSFGDPTGGMSK